MGSQDKIPHIITLSAESTQELENLKDKLVDKLSHHPDTPLSNISFTLNNRKAPNGPCRVAFTSKNSDELLKQLKTVNESTISKPTSSNSKKVCVLFGGIGAAFREPAIQKEVDLLYEGFKPFQEAVDECFHVLIEQHGNVGCINEAKDFWSVPAETQVHSQLQTFCIEYATLKLLEAVGVKPDIVLGHSTGEIGAAYAASVITLEDALNMIVFRNSMEVDPGHMLAIALGADDGVEDLIEEINDEGPNYVAIACENSPTQTVVGGTPSGIQSLQDLCKQRGIRNTKIAAKRAGHTKLMSKAAPNLQKALDGLQKVRTTCTYISSTSGCTLEEISPPYWIANMMRPVKFQEACETLRDLGKDVVPVECSPYPVLSNLLKANGITDVIPNAGDGEEMGITRMLGTIVSLYLRGVDIDWESFHKDFPWKMLDLL